MTVLLAQMTRPSDITFWLSGKCREMEKEAFAPTSVGPSLLTFRDTWPPENGSCISWDSFGFPSSSTFLPTFFSSYIQPSSCSSPHPIPIISSPEIAKFLPLQQSGCWISLHSGQSSLFQALVLSCLETPRQSQSLGPKRKVPRGPQDPHSVSSQRITWSHVAPLISYSKFILN